MSGEPVTTKAQIHTLSLDQYRVFSASVPGKVNNNTTAGKVRRVCARQPNGFSGALLYTYVMAMGGPVEVTVVDERMRPLIEAALATPK